MEPLQVREFRQHLGGAFNRAQEGERVLIRRNRDIYALVHVGREDLEITPELQTMIDEARKDYREGRCVVCSTPEEITRHLDELICTE